MPGKRAQRLGRVLPAGFARLRSGGLVVGAVGTAVEAVEALLEQRHVDDPGRGSGAATDGGGNDHLVAGLDRADAVPLGVDESGAGHPVAMAVAVGAVQRDRRAGNRGDLTVLEGDRLVAAAGLGHDGAAMHGSEQPAQGAGAAEVERAAAGRPYVPRAL